MAIAAERDVQVVAQPRGERDVPAPPEVREADRRVRKAEIIGHGETQAQRRPDRRGRVAGEVAEDLTAEGECSGPGVQRSRDLAAVVDALGNVCEEAVGQHDLVEQPESHEREPEAQLRRAGTPRLGELRHQLGGAHDRTGHQVRKESDEQRVVEQVLRRQRAPQVHVERVRHGGERVEGDADRQPRYRSARGDRRCRSPP